MRPGALLTVAIWLPAAGGAQTCAATPEAAAQSVIGAPLHHAGGPATAGFRVQDAQVDAVLHRVWLRVARCDDAGAPLILIPLRTNIAGISPLPRTADTLKDTGAETPALPSPRVIAVRGGDPVTIVFRSADVQMELEGTADQQAALGDALEVTLRRRADEPAHRMRGVLRADHRVEVLP